MNSSKTNQILNNINTDISLLKNEVVDLGITLRTFNERNKTFAYENLQWPPNDWNYLISDDYSGNTAVGKYQNTEDTNLYVTKYTFGYLHSSVAMNQNEMYHSNSFTNRLGVYNGSTFINENITMNTNRLQYDNWVETGITNSNNDSLYRWQYDFSDAPLKIEPQNYFAHSISGNFSNYVPASITGKINCYRL